MKIFKQGGLSGKLGLITIDHCVKRGNRIVWTTKQVLTLLDQDGQVLCTAQFRSNAIKQAEKFLISLGWEVSEET